MQELLEKLNTLIAEIQNNTAALNNMAASLHGDPDGVLSIDDEEVIKTYLDGTRIAG
jgi:uncharacterized protein YoxC